MIDLATGEFMSMEGSKYDFGRFLYAPSKFRNFVDSFYRRTNVIRQAVKSKVLISLDNTLQEGEE